MADVFVSYSTEDRDRVQKIVSALESNGYSVWWDRRIGIGSSFDREIERELDQSLCVVTVWSANSIESDWVRAESQEGLDRGTLVPVRIDDIKPPLAFRRVQTADLVNNDAHALHSFLEAVGKITTKPQRIPKHELSFDSRATSVNAGRARRIAAVIVVAITLGAGAWWFTTHDAIQLAPPQKMVTPLRSVLVMPLKNLGVALPSGTLEGIHADVISYMGRNGILKMVGKSTADRLLARDESIEVIAAETDASHVAEVILRQEGSLARVSISLVETDTKNNVWSDNFNVVVDESITSHDQLAKKIAGRLYSEIKVWQRLTEETVDARAFELYVRAMELPEYDEKSIQLLEEAVAIQPDFADGYQGLSSSYCFPMPPLQDAEKCLVAARRLIELRPNDPSAHENLGLMYSTRAVNRWDLAVEAYENAEALDDDFTSDQYAFGLMSRGYAEKAVAKSRKVYESNPLNTGPLAAMLLATNRPLEARVLAEQDEYIWNEPAYFDPWEIPLSYIFENDYVRGVEAILQRYDILGDSGKKVQKSTGHIMLARLFYDLDDLEIAEHWLNRTASRFGEQDVNVLQLRLNVAAESLDIPEVETVAQSFLEYPTRDLSVFVSNFEALRNKDKEALARSSLVGTDRATLPFNDIPFMLLASAIVGDVEVTRQLILLIRNYYATGGGTWGYGTPSPHYMPGERRKRFGLALAAILENDWADAIEQFELAFESGWRNQRALEVYALVQDQYGIYGGFTESPAWRAWLEKVADANATDRTTLRTRYPALFFAR